MAPLDLTNDAAATAELFAVRRGLVTICGSAEAVRMEIEKRAAKGWPSVTAEELRKAHVVPHATQRVIDEMLSQDGLPQHRSDGTSNLA